MISIIICSIEPDRFEAVCRNYADVLRHHPFEIVAIHDARSLCEGYNRGIDRSKGDILIFSHDDIEIISPDFAGKLTSYLREYDLIGVAGTSRMTRGSWISAGPPHIFGQVAHKNRANHCYDVCIYGAPLRTATSIQAMDGLFFAATRTLVEAVRFDERTFDGFHFYDVDFSFSAHRAGFRLAVCNDIHIIHSSGGSFDDKWAYYGNRFIEKFDPLPINDNRFSFTQVRVKTKHEVLEVMNPPHWDSPGPALAAEKRPES